VYAVAWTDPVESDGVVERSFRLTRPGRVVPGVLWAPATVGVLPRLVLMGHGGSGHKRSARLVGLGRWFAAAALFDGLGSRDKHWIGYAGGHTETSPGASAIWRSFIRRHLGGSEDRPVE